MRNGYRVRLNQGHRTVPWQPPSPAEDRPRITGAVQHANNDQFVALGQVVIT
jgi:hypothetical protein